MKRLLLLVWALAVTFAAPVRADTNMFLLKSFTGNVNFAGTQVTLRDRSSGASTCKIWSDTTTLSATLTLPTGSTVVGAHLYWAGSGSSDATVTMNSKSVSAASSRIYTSTTIGGGLNYFSAGADVTTQVKAKGGGTYTFSGLKVSNGSPWCDRSAVLGGYALVVIYSNPSETYRTLNLYEGFRAMLNGDVRLDMTNFRVPDNVSASAVGRFGHIVWEGDSDISQAGESLNFYTYTLTQSTYGPSGNNFNSKSSINSDTNSLGIDFDAYSMTGWPAKLNSVAATFRTGGDMVLLNVALLAVPSTPAADLSVELLRTTELRPGALATYTATVTNNGPGVETGPFKVTFALPTGLTYNSFSGTNWNCTGSTTTATCTYNGSLANGAKAAVTLKATVASNATGSKTTTATVVGNNDPQSSNDASSETGIVASSTGLSYVYTTRECLVGETVSTDTGCPLFDGPIVAGNTPKIYVTAVDSNNKARAPNTTANLNVAMGCVNPSTAGTVQPTASGYKLPACAPDASVALSSTTDTKIWTAFPVTFPSGKASIGYDFQYLDAGAVKLYLSTNGTAASSTRTVAQFVSMPASLKLTVRNAEGKLNPGAVGLAGNGFVRAGEDFTIVVEAMSSGSNPVVLPNFGKETGTGRPVLVNSVTGRLDSGLVKEDTFTQIEGDYPLSGPFTGTGFTWSDVGSFALQVALEDYLGEKPTAIGAQNVGRVYPAAYKTVAGPGFACLPHMECPSVGLAAISDAVYSQQPFDATIIALDVNGRELDNFDTTRFPSLVPKLTLTAVDAPGTGAPFGTKITPGLVDTAAATTTRSVQFGLGAQFNADAGKAVMPGPTAVYLRATSDDNRMGTKVVVSSVQSEVAESEEGGIMVVNGRLAIDNVIGSELLKTPIPMRAQYWTGKNWENNTSIESDTLLKAEQAVFSACPPRLRTSSGVCDTSVIKTASAGAIPVKAGSGKYMLAATGAGRTGSFRIKMNTPAWLPSMFGQITLGAYKSPVIFVREVY